MKELLSIAAFGATGALCRYGLGLFVTSIMSLSPIIGTLIINIFGSFVLGFLLGLGDRVDPTWRVGLGVGLLGAFTTFSTFSVDTVRLIQDAQPGLAALNVLGSVGLGLLAAGAGLAASRAMLTA